MHKNTLLFSSMLAVIAALLVGFNLGRSFPKQDTEGTQPSPTPLTSPTPTIAYLRATACGIAFQYPNSLTPIESSDSGTIYASTSDPDATVLVLCQNEIPRIPLTPDKMEARTLRAATGSATVSATLYHDASAKDGTPIDKLIFTHPKTGLDVLIGGIGPIYQQFIASISLL